MPSLSFLFFFFNDTATTEIYTLSLHDALPISAIELGRKNGSRRLTNASSLRHDTEPLRLDAQRRVELAAEAMRSEEHTSELQSLTNLVCRLLLEKKKKNKSTSTITKIHSEQV